MPLSCGARRPRAPAGCVTGTAIGERRGGGPAFCRCCLAIKCWLSAEMENPPPPSLPACSYLGRAAGHLLCLVTSPRRLERGRHGSSPTSGVFPLTTPAPRPVLGPVAPPDLPHRAPAQDLLGQPGPSPAELSLPCPSTSGFLNRAGGRGRPGLVWTPSPPLHVLPSLGRATHLLIALGSPSPEWQGHDGDQGSMTYGAISRHPASISPA